MFSNMFICNSITVRSVYWEYGCICDTNSSPVVLVCYAVMDDIHSTPKIWTIHHILYTQHFWYGFKPFTMPIGSEKGVPYKKRKLLYGIEIGYNISPPKSTQVTEGDYVKKGTIQNEMLILMNVNSCSDIFFPSFLYCCPNNCRNLWRHFFRIIKGKSDKAGEVI